MSASRPLKVAPSIKLVKQPLDLSSTEPDSEQEFDLVNNVGKSITRTVRKKSVQTRKDSAPVYRTTYKDTVKMARSTSENTFKQTNTSTLKKKNSKDVITHDSTGPTSPTTKRPVKCVTTKTINLTATSNLPNKNAISSEDLDNVVIDIQLAKSSREPTPNKMIPVTWSGCLN